MDMCSKRRREKPSVTFMFLRQTAEQNFKVKTHNKSTLDVAKFEYLGVFQAENLEENGVNLHFFLIGERLCLSH
jgi:hypothetical protein